jgi:glycosyltransferase involved in cell wall biosynthesis
LIYTTLGKWEIKMKLLFCYSGPLIKDSECSYYSRTITDDVLSRYLSIANEVIILTRVKKVDNKEELKRFTKITSNNVRIVQCPNILTPRGLLFNSNEAEKIIKDVVKQVDSIIVRLPSIIGNFVTKQAQVQGKSYLVESVGCPWDAYWNHSLKGKIIAPYMWFKTRSLIKNAPFTLYVSERFLQNRYPCSGETIGCSDVVLQPLNKNILDERLYKIENVFKEKDIPIVLGTIAGVDVRYKGQQYVIEAISKLNKKGYNFEYHLVGGGNQKFLKDLARKYNIIDKVKFLGSIPHKDVFGFIKNIDIYIQPSNAESHGRVIVEAMSTACPVIGSSTGGIPELVSIDLVFKRKDVKDLMDKLENITKERLIAEAKRSFEKAKEFDKVLLDKKRNDFYLKFKNSVKTVT